MSRAAASNMGSSAILELLAAKHAGDVFIPECKNGPTQYGSHLRMDAWTMAKSWAHPRVRVYEIKVSRSDFLADTKWPGYLPYCNEFYFVCPAGLIDKTEVGEQAGLLCVSKTGTMLYTKKKAPYRDVEVPESLYRYLLMNRARIGRERELTVNDDNAEYWQRWLEDKSSKMLIGRSASKELAARVANRIAEVEAENERLTEDMSKYAEVKKYLDSIGVDYLSGFDPVGGVRRKMERLAEIVPWDLEQTIKILRDRLDDTIDLIKKSKVPPQGHQE